MTTKKAAKTMTKKAMKKTKGGISNEPTYKTKAEKGGSTIHGPILR